MTSALNFVASDLNKLGLVGLEWRSLVGRATRILAQIFVHFLLHILQAACANTAAKDRGAREPGLSCLAFRATLSLLHYLASGRKSLLSRERQKETSGDWARTGVGGAKSADWRALTRVPEMNLNLRVR